MRPLVLAFSVVVAGGAAGFTQPGAPAAWLRVDAVASPTGPGSALPQLTTSRRGVLLSWVEQSGGRATLKFSEHTGNGWSPVRTVASGTDWFVNWADVPSVLRLTDGTLAAHWLQRSGTDTYAYDVRLSYSRDDGRTWAPSFTPHHDGTRTEHGFASLFQMPGAGSGLGLVWLDGRNMRTTQGAGSGEHGSGDMSLRFASFDRAWKQIADEAVDPRVCECCPTAAAVTADGPVVVYRDRADGEVRDIHVARLTGGKWSVPAPVSKDGWQFPACPVNGPSVSARGRTVAASWFQARDGQPKSFVAFSSDGGRTFGAPIRLDADGTLGRVDVEMLPDGSAAAAYIDLAGDRAELRVRRVTPTGSASAPVTVANLANSRSSGYPRMAFFGDELVFAWVDREGDSIVRTASARLSAGTR
jgi:hypothetical protein